jgi:hypothetical protein
MPWAKNRIAASHPASPTLGAPLISANLSDGKDKPHPTSCNRAARLQVQLADVEEGPQPIAAPASWPSQRTHGGFLLTGFQRRSSAVQHSHCRDSARAR